MPGAMSAIHANIEAQKKVSYSRPTLAPPGAMGAIHANIEAQKLVERLGGIHANTSSSPSFLQPPGAMGAVHAAIAAAHVVPGPIAAASTIPTSSSSSSSSSSSPWVPATDPESGHAYWYNEVTGESSWVDPAAAQIGSADEWAAAWPTDEVDAACADDATAAAAAAAPAASAADTPVINLESDADADADAEIAAELAAEAPLSLSASFDMGSLAHIFEAAAAQEETANFAAIDARGGPTTGEALALSGSFDMDGLAHIFEEAAARQLQTAWQRSAETRADRAWLAENLARRGAAIVVLLRAARWWKVRLVRTREADSATALQSRWRGRSARREMSEQDGAAAVLQRRVRGGAARAGADRRRAAAGVVGRAAKGHCARQKAARASAATTLQAAYHRRVATQRAKALAASRRGATALQRVARGRASRRATQQRRDAVATLQNAQRGQAARTELRKRRAQRGAATKLQAAARGTLARNTAAANSAATTMQAAERGRAAKRTYAVAVETKRQRCAAATQLQCTARRRTASRAVQTRRVEHTGAALLVQRGERRRQARKRTECATKLQSVARVRKARGALATRRAVHQQRGAAATQMQSAQRCKQARRVRVEAVAAQQALAVAIVPLQSRLRGEGARRQARRERSAAAHLQARGRGRQARADYAVAIRDRRARITAAQGVQRHQRGRAGRRSHAEWHAKRTRAAVRVQCGMRSHHARGALASKVHAREGQAARSIQSKSRAHLQHKAKRRDAATKMQCAHRTRIARQSRVALQRTAKRRNAARQVQCAQRSRVAKAALDDLKNSGRYWVMKSEEQLRGGRFVAAAALLRRALKLNEIHKRWPRPSAVPTPTCFGGGDLTLPHCVRVWELLGRTMLRMWWFARRGSDDASLDLLSSHATESDWTQYVHARAQLNAAHAAFSYAQIMRSQFKDDDDDDDDEEEEETSAAMRGLWSEIARVYLGLGSFSGCAQMCAKIITSASNDGADIDAGVVGMAAVAMRGLGMLSESAEYLRRIAVSGDEAPRPVVLRSSSSSSHDAITLPPVIVPMPAFVALMALGRVQTLAGRTKDAKKVFKQCAAYRGTNAFAKHAAQHDSWKRWFADPQLWMLLFRACESSGNWILAADFTREALERERAAPALWLAYAVTTTRLGDWKNARDAARRAKVLDSRGIAAGVAVAALEQRRIEVRKRAAISLQSIARLRRVMRRKKQHTQSLASVQLQSVVRRHGVAISLKRRSAAATVIAARWRQCSATVALAHSRSAVTRIANAWRCVDARWQAADAAADLCDVERDEMEVVRLRLERLKQEAWGEGGIYAPPLNKLRAVKNKIEREHTSLGDLRELAGLTNAIRESEAAVKRETNLVARLANEVALQIDPERWGHRSPMALIDAVDAELLSPMPQDRRRNQHEHEHEHGMSGSDSATGGTNALDAMEEISEERTETQTTRRRTTRTRDGVEEEVNMTMQTTKQVVKRKRRATDNPLEHRVKLLDDTIRTQSKALLDSESSQNRWPELFAHLQRQLRNYKLRMHEAKSLGRVQGAHAVLFESGGNDAKSAKLIDASIAELRRANARVRAKLRKAGVVNVGAGPSSSTGNAKHPRGDGTGESAKSCDLDEDSIESNLAQQRTLDAALKKKNAVAQSSKVREVKLATGLRDMQYSALADVEKKLKQTREQTQRLHARLNSLSRKDKARRLEARSARHIVADFAAAAAVAAATAASGAAAQAVAELPRPRSAAGHLAVVQSLVRRRLARQKLAVTSPIAVEPMERWSARQRLTTRRARVAEVKSRRFDAVGRIQTCWRRSRAARSDGARADREMLAILRAQNSQIALMKARLAELEKTKATETTASGASGKKKKKKKKKTKTNLKQRGKR